MREHISSILVVDADRTNAEVIAAILDDEGYDACQATQPAVALERIVDHHPTLIILDATLHRLSPSRLRRFLEAHNLAHTVIIRSTTAPAQAAGAYRGSPDAWVLKPFTIERLLACVAKALGEASRAPESRVVMTGQLKSGAAAWRLTT